MRFDFKFLMLGTLTFLSASAGTPAAKHPSMPDILAASPPADWRALDLDNTLYVEVPGGRTIATPCPPESAKSNRSSIPPTA